MLEKKRKEHALSQLEAAEVIGAQRASTVSKIESGSMFPRPEVLLAIRATFGISADELLDHWASTHGRAAKKAQHLARVFKARKLLG